MKGATVNINKPAWEMNRRERREYKRWLDKNNMWDGYFVYENQTKKSILNYRA